jgi:hypothetical protein
MEADWVLRAAVGPRVSQETFPARTRQLTHDQVQRLWWDLRDAGVMGRDGAGAAGGDGGGSAGASTARGDERIEAVYVVSYTASGVRRAVPVVAEPGARRLAERLSGLAWVTR